MSLSLPNGGLNPVLTGAGARAYYVNGVLLNWPDSACEDILSHIKQAMKPGYSKLLINDIVMPPTGAHWEATAIDIMMLTLLSSKVRARSAWHELIERGVGLNIREIWSDECVRSLIECDLLEQ